MMNGGSNFGRRNYQTYGYDSYQVPCQVNVPCPVNEPATISTSNPQFYQYNDSYGQLLNHAATSNTKNFSLPYFHNNQVSVNNHQNPNVSRAASDYYGNFSYGNEHDSYIVQENRHSCEIDFPNGARVPKTLQASATCFVPFENRPIPGIEKSDIEKQNIGILKETAASGNLEHILDNSSQGKKVANPNNGTRPKEPNHEKTCDSKNYSDTYRNDYSRNRNVSFKRNNHHSQNSKQKDSENYYSYETSSSKNHDEYNNCEARNYGRGRGRGRGTNSNSYIKKSEWKNSSHNQYVGSQNHGHETYNNQDQKWSSLPADRGRFYGKQNSFNNYLHGQSAKRNDYGGNFGKYYGAAKQEPSVSYQSQNGYQNEHSRKGDSYNSIRENKINFNQKYDKRKVSKLKFDAAKSELGSQEEFQEEAKVGRLYSNTRNKMIIPVKPVLKENTNVNKLLISQNAAILDARTQRETMIDLLTQGLYECMVCCERIKQQHAIWSCSKCYNCFHLGCTKKWAGTSQGDPGWRCPACQNLNAKVPSGYYCFCKKMREPDWNRRETPHSCGEVCALRRENEWCTHKCTNLCHPGPCPECSAFVKRSCRCGKNTKEMRCSITEPYLCGEKCLKPLNCGIHFCQQICHIDSCEVCTEVIVKKCYCGKESKTVLCTEETANEPSFSCNDICSKTLNCNHHTCQSICHPGPCDSCDKTAAVVRTCPCGKMNLNSYYKENGISPRSSCTDAIPTCNNICDKLLKCGTPGSYHTCQSLCHEGHCPSCQRQTAVKCRCGFVDKNIPCTELHTKADEVMCEKQCKKLRQCGRHKCGVKCCIDVDHICDKICGKTLKCRLHKCQEPCHRGNCPRCWETSFDELSCHCGSSVIYPPVSCGTEPPSCNLPCKRQQPCTHPVSHNCHADAKCPPCTTLVSKSCFGNHTIMKSTPCYVNGMSCGDQCGKMLPCKIHKCLKVCHEGSCVKGAKCNQNCTEMRKTCEHACNNPCHAGPCPNTPCKEMVSVSCICGNRKVDMVCSDNEKEYKSLATSKLASMMHNMNNGGSVDLSNLFSGSNKVEKFQRLECNDECGLLERNRRLALALQITNPDSRDILGENSLYPENMKDEARKDMQFAKLVHNSLHDLVLKARESKQKNRSYSFAPMNRDKRRFIHEYSKFFGCQSQSYDEEPKKNVVVTACKIGSHLPPVSIVSVIQKEQGQRKVPGPVLSRKNVTSDETSNSMKKLEKSGSFEKKDGQGKTVDCSKRLTASSTENEKAPAIDYFDFS